MPKNRSFPLILTFGPIGYQTGGGTLVSAFVLPMLVSIRYLFDLSRFSYLIYSVFVIICTYYAFFSINTCVKQKNLKDPREIVLDEVIGMAWLFIVPSYSFIDVLLRFILFRFFDVTKWGIASLEKLPGAWGILADDIAAALIGEAIVLVFFS